MPFRVLLPVLASVVLTVAAGELGAAEGMALPGLDGGQLASEDVGEGAVILVVWASWSPRCRDIVTRVNALARRWSPRARVATVVFQEEAGAVRAFLAGESLAVPVYIDATGSFSKQHGVATLPSLLVFRDGELSFRGKLPAHPDTVIERALG